MIHVYENIQIDDDEWKKTSVENEYKVVDIIEQHGHLLWKKYDSPRSYFTTEIYINFIYQWLIPTYTQRIYITHGRETTSLAIVLQKGFVSLDKFYNQKYPIISVLEKLVEEAKDYPEAYEMREKLLKERLLLPKNHDMFEVGKGLEDIIFVGALLDECDLKGLNSYDSNVGVIVDKDDNIHKYFRIDLDQSFLSSNEYFIINHHPIFLTHVDLIEHFYLFKNADLNPRVSMEFKKSMVNKCLELMSEVSFKKDRLIEMVKLIEEAIEKEGSNNVMKMQIKEIGLFKMYGRYMDMSKKRPVYRVSDCVKLQIETFETVFSQTQQERLDSFIEDSTELMKQIPNKTEEILKYQIIVMEVLGKKHTNICAKCGKIKR